jgi:hypothetical protein
MVLLNDKIKDVGLQGEINVDQHGVQRQTVRSIVTRVRIP